MIAITNSKAIIGLILLDLGNSYSQIGQEAAFSSISMAHEGHSFFSMMQDNPFTQKYDVKGSMNTFRVYGQLHVQ